MCANLKPVKTFCSLRIGTRVRAIALHRMVQKCDGQQVSGGPFLFSIKLVRLGLAVFFSTFILFFMILPVCNR